VLIGGALLLPWGLTTSSIQNPDFCICHVHTNIHASTTEVNLTKDCHSLPPHAPHIAFLPFTSRVLLFHCLLRSRNLNPLHKYVLCVVLWSVGRKDNNEPKTEPKIVVSYHNACVWIYGACLQLESNLELIYLFSSHWYIRCVCWWTNNHNLIFNQITWICQYRKRNKIHCKIVTAKVSTDTYCRFVQNCLRTSETSVDNYFTRQYIPEDNSEHHTRRRENLKSHVL
jgi:hypothetical protein